MSELPANLTVHIQRTRAMFQRMQETVAEESADFERVVMEFEKVAGAGIANEAHSNVTRGTAQIPAESKRSSGLESQEPTRPEPSPFDSLPWKTNSANIQWVFSNAAGAEALVAKIGKQKGNVFIEGGFDYRLSGDKTDATKFINRTRSKSK